MRDVRITNAAGLAAPTVPHAALDARIRVATLGPGESEAISLALEIGVDWIVLDDAPGRRLAESMKLPVIGTLGVLLMAKQEGVINEVKPFADALLSVNFRVSPSLFARPTSSG
jgi:predicted nucleic acid-binding protein